MAKLFQTDETKYNGIEKSQTVLLNAKKVINCVQTDTDASTIKYKRFGNENPDVIDIALAQDDLVTALNDVANSNTDGSSINVTVVDKITGATSTKTINLHDFHRAVPYSDAQFETAVNMIEVENPTQTGMEWYLVSDTQQDMLDAANGVD